MGGWCPSPMSQSFCCRRLNRIPDASQHRLSGPSAQAGRTKVEARRESQGPENNGPLSIILLFFCLNLSLPFLLWCIRQQIGKRSDSKCKRLNKPQKLDVTVCDAFLPAEKKQTQESGIYGIQYFNVPVLITLIPHCSSNELKSAPKVLLLPTPSRQHSPEESYVGGGWVSGSKSPRKFCGQMRKEQNQVVLTLEEQGGSNCPSTTGGQSMILHLKI